MTVAIKNLLQNDLQAMDNQYRAHFINSLSGYKNVNLVGTIDQKGVTNLSVISSLIHLGSSPALVAFIHKPSISKRNTLDNIVTSECFTINQVSRDFYQDAHHTSARYPAELSEFDYTNLAEEFSEVAAPYVKQSLIKFAVEFKQRIDIELNGTVLLIGEIVEIIIDDALIGEDGKIDIQAAKTVSASGLDEYHLAESLGRLAYAKPKI